MLTVILDPGHGGTRNVGGSDANHATSLSGVLEKDMTLRLALTVKSAVESEGLDARVLLTRDRDVNLSLRDRAAMAAANGAELFLSIHFNGYDGRTRGTETWIESVANGNLNYTADRDFARRVQSAVYGTIQRHDPDARDRGVKENQVLGVIRDAYLGNDVKSALCRACLVEVEFIDVPDVDRLLNTGPAAGTVQTELAHALKTAILGELQVPYAFRTLVARRKVAKKAKKRRSGNARRPERA